MKIKDTKQYIGDIIGSQDTLINPLVGNTPLLKEIVGGGNSAKGHIKGIAKFADNATQQLIFELLQNADDANNDNEREGVFQVFFDDNYFLAINNGKPFTMDTTVKRGSLIRFLSWGVRGESTESYTGKYGKGSKLLYNLFIDETDTNNEDDEKRADAIFNKHNGPIIFSWSNLNGIEDLKTFDENSGFKPKDYKDNNYPLLTKLINTYYPASPNEIHQNSKGKVDVFPNKEIAELSNFLNENLKPDPNFVWDRGTLIFVKLGNEQKEKLEFKYEDSIRYYLSFSKNISFVKINDTVIKKEMLKSTGKIKIKDHEIKDHEYEIAFPVSDDVEDASFVNFYNPLPVLKESHGFKFIINTKHLSTLENRQNIDFSNSYNKSRLDDVVKVIEKYFQNKDIDFSNKMDLYKAILLSEDEKIQKDELKGFYENLIDLLKKYIPGNNGFITDETENVIINVSGLPVNLNDVGLNEYSWLNESLLPYKKEVKELLEINDWDINDILENGNNKKIKNWIGHLSKDDYKQFVTTIENSSFVSFKQIPIIKASDKEVYSVDEFNDADDKTFLTSRTIELGNVLNKLGIITSHKLFSKIAEKLIGEDEELKAIISIVNENKEQIQRGDKWEIIETLIACFPDEQNNISNDIEIFKNTDGDYVSLSNLLPTINGYVPYELFKYLKIEEAENNEVLQDLFLDENEIWDKVINDWEPVILKEYERNPNKDSQYMKDIYNTLLKIYKESNSSSCVNSNIRIFLTTERLFVSRDEIFINSSLSIFNESEYTELESIFEKTDISIPAYFLISDFQKKPFNTRESSISEFIDNLGNEITISRKGISVLRKLVSEIGESFFDYFIIESKEEEEYKLTGKKDNQIQYYCTDDKVNGFLKDKDNYYLLPQELKNIFNNSDGLIMGDSQEFIRGIINDYGSRREFIDIVLTQRTAIVSEYISKLRVDLDSKEKYGKASFEAKIIQYCINQHPTNNNFVDAIKSKIFINDNKLDHYEFLDEVKVNGLKFSLSALLPEYKGISEVISDVKAHLDVNGLNNLFTAKPKQNEDIFNEINVTNLTLTQLSFAVAYHKIAKLEEWEYSDKGESLNKTDKLNELFEKQLDYTKYFQIEAFKPEIQILTSNSGLLLNDEILPQWVNEWIEQDTEKKKDKIKYLKKLGVVDDKSEVIKIRYRLTQDKYVEPAMFEKCTKKEYLSNTIKWAKDKWDSIGYKSDKYNAISKLIEFCMKKYSTFDYGLFFNTFINNEITLTIRKQEKGQYYILENEYIDKIGNSKNPSLKSIIIFGKDNEGLKSKLKKYDKDQMIIEKEFAEEEANEAYEWEAVFYKNWKNDEVVDYKGIYISKSDLPFNYILKSNDNKINEILGNWSDGDVALDEKNKEIFISESVIEGGDIIKALEDKIEKLFISQKDKEQFRLLYKYERDELKGNGSGQGGSADTNKNNSETDKQSLPDNYNDLLKISNSLGLSKLKKLLESGKEIDDLLEALEEKEIAEERTSIGKIYGYIGEALFNAYLSNKNDNFEWSSQKERIPIYAYDFELNDTKVDVKTNIASLKESNGSLPFYIHKNALEYIKNNSKNKYDIVRISLKDLGLEEWARSLSKSIKLVDAILSKEVKNQINEKAKDFMHEHNDFYKKIVVFSIKDVRTFYER